MESHVKLSYQSIGSGWLEKLAQVIGFQVLVLLDDSASMAQPLSRERQKLYKRAGITR